MYNSEREIIIKMGVQLGETATMTDVLLFESLHGVNIPAEIKWFYLELNGYENVPDMVELYSLEGIKTVVTSGLNLPPISGIDNFFVIGDFGFQASFWLLEILEEDRYKLHVLKLGVVMLVEIPLSFKSFFSSLLNDPYSVIGM